MQTIPETLATALQYHQKGELSSAEQLYRQILHQQPNHVQALHLLGLIACQNGFFEEALTFYQQVINLQPDYVLVYNDFGSLLRQQGKIEQAIGYYEQAIALKPDFAEAYYNLGNAFQEQAKPKEAIACYQQVISLKNNFTEAYYNLGNAYYESLQLHRAIAAYDRTITLNPNHINAHWNLAFTLLTTGDLQRGFAEYEWRWQHPAYPPRLFSQPIWDGSLLNGKTILIHAEQGFGDTIHFIRYATMVAELGGQVIVACPEALLRILTTVPKVGQVVSIGDNFLNLLPSFDVHVPLMSLPLLLGTTLETIPANVPYLSPPESHPLKLKTSTKSRLKVGIAWKGGNLQETHYLGRRRSCKLTQLLPILELSCIEFYSLQKGSPRGRVG